MSTHTETIPVDRSVVCLDCEVVFRVESRTCPRCGGDAFVALTSWLGSAQEVTA